MRRTAGGPGSVLAASGAAASLVRRALLVGALVLAVPAHARRPPPVVPVVAPADPLVPDERAVAAASLAPLLAEDPERWVQPLVDLLVGDTDDPAVKLRRLHDWVALNVDYDAAGFLAGTPAGGGWQDTLRRGTSVCEGYARLMAELGTRAGLEVKVVVGYARAYGYEVTGDEDVARSDHAWNAVRLDDRWVLVDVTWDAGKVSDGRFVPAYTTRWLAPDPAVFVHSHLPKDPAWQLLPVPVEPAAMVELPLVVPVPGRSVSFAPGTPRREIVDGGFTIDLHGVHASNLRAWLRRDGVQGFRGTTWIEPVDGGARVRVVLPEPGAWELHLGARRDGPVWFAGVARTSATGSPLRLPIAYDWRPEYTLMSPMLPYDPADPPRVTLRLPGVDEAFLVVGDRWIPMVRERDVFAVHDPGPWTEEALVVASRAGGGRETVIGLPGEVGR